MKKNRTTNEPSGIRLMRLMSSQLSQIINKELKNETRICLYGTGEYWTAFEKSAYMLSLLFPTSDISIVEHQEYPFPVVLASISDDELNVYGTNHIFSHESLDYKELLTLEIQDNQYWNWHQQQVVEFMVKQESSYSLN